MTFKTRWFITGTFLFFSLIHVKDVLASYATVIEPQSGQYYSLQGDTLQICKMQESVPDCQKAVDFGFDLLAPARTPVKVEIMGKDESQISPLVGEIYQAGDNNHIRIPFVSNGEFNRENMERYFMGENGMVGVFQKYTLYPSYETGSSGSDGSGSPVLVSDKSQPDFFVPLGQANVRAKNQPVCIENRLGKIDLEIQAFPSVEVLLVVMDQATKEILTDVRVQTDETGKAEYSLNGLAKGNAEKIQIVGFFGSKRANLSGAAIEKLMTIPESLVALNTGATVQLPACIPLDQHSRGQCTNQDGSKFAIAGLKRIPGVRGKFAVIPDRERSTFAPPSNEIISLDVGEKRQEVSESGEKASCDIQVDIPPQASQPYNLPGPECVGPECDIGMDEFCEEVTPPREVCTINDVPNQPCAYSMDCTNLKTGKVTHISPLVYVFSKEPTMFTIRLDNRRGTLPVFDPPPTQAPEQISISPQGELVRSETTKATWNVLTISNKTLIAVKTKKLLEAFIEILGKNPLNPVTIKTALEDLKKDLVLAPYLFYEFTLRKGMKLTKPEKGFVVAQENLQGFLLDTIMERLGLNNAQKQAYLEDIIPRIKSSPYYFIGLVDEQEWENTIVLETSPAVQERKRIMLYIEGIQTPVNVEEPLLSGVPDPASFDSFLLELGVYIK